VASSSSPPEAAKQFQGLGIALVAAHKAGVPVVLVDSSQASLDKGLKFADKLLEKDISKQKITREQAEAVKGRLTTTTTMDSLSDVDFVIEAIPVSLGE